MEMTHLELSVVIPHLLPTLHSEQPGFKLGYSIEQPYKRENLNHVRTI